MKKMISVVLSLSMILLILPASYAINDYSTTVINYETINGANVVEGEAVDKLDVTAHDFNLTYNKSTGYKASLVFEELELEFDIDLGYANSEESCLAAYSEDESNGYRITNFKITKHIPYFMLMKANQELSDSTVLSIGIESESGDFFYFQIPVDEDSMEIIDDCCRNTMRTFSAVDFSSLYKTYLTGAHSQTKHVESIEELSESSNMENLSNLYTSPTVKPVYEAFPLSYFNGSAMYEKVTGTYGKYDYARESSYFVGTTNVLTYIVGMYKHTHTDYPAQTFYGDYELDYNDAVIYNPDANQIFVWSDVKTPGSVSSPTILIGCYNLNGCIIRREQYAYTGGSLVNKIVKAVITWVPYLSSASSSVETLTSNEANTIKTYGDNISDQLERYGKRIESVKVESKGLRSPGDHVYLEVNGDNITSAYIRFSCDVRF